MKYSDLWKRQENRGFIKLIASMLAGILGLGYTAGTAYKLGQIRKMKQFDAKGYDPIEILSKSEIETEEDSE